MTKIIYVLLLSMLVISCARYSEHGDAPIVRSGILKQGIDMQAFLDVWGAPDRTNVITIDSKNAGLYASWNAFGGKLRGGDQSYTYQEWSYEKFGVNLLFDKEELVSWKTDKTVSEIKALAKPLPKRY